MSWIFAVNNSVVFGALLVTFCGGLAFAESPGLSARANTLAASAAPWPANRQVEFICSGNDVPPGFPARVRFKILSSAQIEASGFDRADNQTAPSLMRRSDRLNSPGAVFPMGGMLGVSGNAALSMAPTALEVGEVGTILIQNHSTIESVVYLCSKMR